MKKHVLGLAVLAAASAVASTAYAQNVAISGTMDVAVQNNNTGVFSQRLLGTSVWRTSRLTLSGSEDLGGGLKAKFAHETRIYPDTGVMTLGDRDSWLGIEGGFGEVRMGRTTSAATDVDSFVNAFGGNQGLFGSRWMTTAETATDAGTTGTAANTSIEGVGDKVTNSIHYLSPTISGFQGQLQYGMGEATTQATKGNSDTTAVSLSYAAGPLKAIIATAKQKRKGATVTYGDIRQSGYGLQYDAGFAKVGIAAISQDRDTRSAGNTTTGTVVTANVPLGNGLNIFGALHTIKVDGVSDTSSSATVIGANRDLSKRTMVYATYANTSNDSAASYNITGQTASTAANGYDPKVLSVGVRHLF